LWSGGFKSDAISARGGHVGGSGVMVYKGGVDWKAPGAFQTHYARAEFVAYDLPGVNNCDRKASGGQTQCSIVARGPGAYDDNIVQILDPSRLFRPCLKTVFLRSEATKNLLARS
jgi:hypothetical protein